MELFTAYHDSPVGILKIQCSEQHVVLIHFVETAGLENDQTELLQKTIKQLDEYFSGKRKDFDLSLGQRGSAFQENVWNHLIKISFGKTISYLQLSKQIGDVKAIRAIASANGKNNLAIVVPCHRVIGSDAKLVGYAGGLWRKKWLLEHEARIHSGIEQLSLLNN
jgi:methylated-DNA-[protein]-cysteine S-methyltransferase